MLSTTAAAFAVVTITEMFAVSMANSAVPASVLKTEPDHLFTATTPLLDPIFRHSRPHEARDEVLPATQASSERATPKENETRTPEYVKSLSHV